MTASLQIHFGGVFRDGKLLASGDPVSACLPAGHWLIGSRLPPEAVGLRIDLPTVSRRHAELWIEDGRWQLRDCGSDNGVWTYPELERVEQIVLAVPTRLLLGEALLEITPIGPR